jgi:uncharacterized protein (TIGR02145 family)
MRILKLNDIIVDIDEQTAIGVDLQVYDVKEPAKPKVKISNSFTIPITNKNLGVIGYIGDVQNTETTIYDVLLCDYYIDNSQYITQAKTRVQSVKGRIELFIYEKSSFWDDIKTEKWVDFISDYFDFLSIPTLASPFIGNYISFLNQYITHSTTGVQQLFLPFCISNEWDELGFAMLESYTYARMVMSQGSGSGHFYSFLTPVFKYIEDKYDVDFNISETFNGNVFQDTVFNSIFWNYRDLAINQNVTKTGYYFSLQPASATSYLNSFDSDETRDKTLYDFILAVFQQFNIVVDDNNGSIRLARLDDIITGGDIVDFSGGLSKKPINYKPLIEGYGQDNLLKWKDVESGLDPDSNSKTLTCLNKNIDQNITLFEINGFIPGFTDQAGNLAFVVPNYATKDSFKNFKFLINTDKKTDTDYSQTIEVKTYYTSALDFDTQTFDLIIPALYELDSEYTEYDDAIDYPKWYEIDKWVNSLDLLNFDMLKLYWIRELNGSFFMNKIKGFNPDKSRQATTMELVRVSDRKPDVPNFPAINGYLYNWYAASDANFAPTDWKVPNDTELNTLITTLGGTLVAGGEMKETGFDFWDSPNTGANNNSGFTGYGSGQRTSVGNFNVFKTAGMFWSSIQQAAGTANMLTLQNTNKQAVLSLGSKKQGESIRLLYTGSGSPQTVTDNDGNIYDVVLIGSQRWTVQNWKCTTLDNGTSIPNVTDSVAWAALTTLGRCAYNNDENNV